MPDLKSLIREVPDFPKPGILFYDITTLLKDPCGFHGVIDGLKDHYRDIKVDTVLGIEARGFIFAPALAYALNARFVPLRKPKKLPDVFHELRTIFQTISLADTLEIAFTPARKTAIELTDALNIADNLVVRAARMTMDAMRATGRIEMRLTKRIPMGAGLGGGSSDAAAVLLALPVLTGRSLPLPKFSHIPEQPGSDLPFFLLAC